MSFLKETLDLRVNRAMGWVAGAWPAAIGRLDIYNEAGTWLYTSRSWSFLESMFEDLNLVEGQNYIDLPDDFGGFLGVSSGRENVACSLRMSNYQAVLDQRQFPAQSLGGFVGCLAHREGDTENPERIPIIAIGPTPRASVMQALQLAYAGTWATIKPSTTKLRIPPWMVPLYIRTVIEYVKGYERRLEGELDDRLLRLVSGPLYQAAVTYDDNLQPDCGGISGTAEQEAGYSDDPFIAPLGRFTTRVTGA